MSLGISIIAKDGIVLASDSRATIGDPRGLTTANDTVKKVFRLSDHCGLIMVGAGELGMSILDRVTPVLEGKPDLNQLSVDQILAEISPVFVNNYNQWFGAAPPPGRPPLACIVAGYTKSGNAFKEPRIVTLLSQLNFAPSTNAMGFAAAGVTPLGVYLLNRLYKPDISSSAALQLAAYCISETISQDGKVGGPLQLAKYAKTSPYKPLDTGEIDKILVDLKTHTENLRSIFFRRGSK